MMEPMQAVQTAIVRASGPVTFPLLTSADISTVVGTLVWVRMGTSWEEVRSLNIGGALLHDAMTAIRGM